METVDVPIERSSPGLFRRIGLSAGLLGVQAVVWLSSSLVLDFGVVHRAFTICFAGYWAGVALIAFRRSHEVSASDRWFVRWGWLVLTTTGTCAALAYWKATGAV